MNRNEAEQRLQAVLNRISKDTSDLPETAEGLSRLVGVVEYLEAYEADLRAVVS